MKQLNLPLGRLAVAAVVAVALALGVSSAPGASAATTTITTSPALISPAPLSGSNFTITVTENSSVLTTGTQTTINFNPYYFQINAGTVVYGADFLAVDWVQTAGTAGQTLAQAITEANTTGQLKNVASYVNGPPGTATLSTGPHTFFTVQFHAQPTYHGALVHFTPSNSETLDANGLALPVTNTGTATAASSVGGVSESPQLPLAANTSAQASSRIDLMPIGVWGGIALVLMSAGAFIVYRRVAQGRMRR